MTKFTIMMSMLAATAVYGAEAPRSFHVEVRGHGEPIILIPGLSSSPEVWDETVARYKDRYECHLITLAGFVGKPRIEQPFLDTVRRDLIAYMREKKMKKPAIVGHSLGGFLAMWIAATEPDLPGKLMLVDSLPYLAATTNPEITPEAAKAMAENMRQQMLKGASESKGTDTTWVRGMTAKPEGVERLVDWGKRSDPRAVADAMYEMWVTDLRPALAKITCPTVVLGTWIAYKDFTTKAVIEKTFEAQYAKLSNVRIHVFDTARHFIMWDDPQGFFADMDSFLGVK